MIAPGRIAQHHVTPCQQLLTASVNNQDVYTFLLYNPKQAVAAVGHTLDCGTKKALRVYLTIRHSWKNLIILTSHMGPASLLVASSLAPNLDAAVSETCTVLLGLPMSNLHSAWYDEGPAATAKVAGSWRIFC